MVCVGLGGVEEIGPKDNSERDSKTQKDRMQHNVDHLKLTLFVLLLCNSHVSFPVYVNPNRNREHVEAKLSHGLMGVFRGRGYGGRPSPPIAQVFALFK